MVVYRFLFLLLLCLSLVMSRDDGGDGENGDSDGDSDKGGKGRHNDDSNDNKDGNKDGDKHNGNDNGDNDGSSRGGREDGQSTTSTDVQFTTSTDIAQFIATSIAFPSFPPVFAAPPLPPQQPPPFFNEPPFFSIAPPTFLDAPPAPTIPEVPTITSTSTSTFTSSTPSPINTPSITTSDSTGTTTSALVITPSLLVNEGPEITNPTLIEPCSQVTVSWTGGASPFEFKAIPGSGLQAPESWTQSTNDYVHSFYNNLAAPGDILAIYVCDSNGSNTTRSYIVSGEANAACLAAMSTIEQERASIALSAPTSSVKSSSSPMLSTPTLAGIGIGVVALATLVGMAIWLYRRKVVNRKSGSLPFHIVTNNNPHNSTNSDLSFGYTNDKQFPVTFDRQDSVGSRRTDTTERSRWNVTLRGRDRDRDRLAALEEAAGVQVHVDTTRVIQRDGFGPSPLTSSQLASTPGVTRQRLQVNGSQYSREAANGSAHSTVSDQERRHKPHPMYWAKPTLPSNPASAPKAPIIVQLDDNGQPSPPFGDEQIVMRNDHDSAVYAMNGLASGDDVVDPYIIDFRGGIVRDSMESDFQSQPQAQRRPEMTSLRSRFSMGDDDPSGPFGNKFAIKEPTAATAGNGQSGNQGHTSNGSQFTDPVSRDSRVDFGDVLATKMDPALADILAKRMNRRAEHAKTSTDPSGTDLPSRI